MVWICCISSFSASSSRNLHLCRCYALFLRQVVLACWTSQFTFSSALLVAALVTRNWPKRRLFFSKFGECTTLGSRSNIPKGGDTSRGGTFSKTPNALLAPSHWPSRWGQNAQQYLQNSSIRQNIYHFEPESVLASGHCMWTVWILFNDQGRSHNFDFCLGI